MYFFSMSEIHFKQSNCTLTWDDSYENILELAEANDIALPFSCRMGNCTSCQQALESGEVSYPYGHTGEPEPSHALLCCSKPKEGTDLIIDA